MNKTKAVKLIRATFDRAPEIYNGFFRVIQDTLLDECVAAERQHRRGRPAVPGFSVQDAGRYFAVKYLRDYLLNRDKIPAVQSYLHIRHECFTAAAIVLEHGAELVEWVGTIPAEFDSIDYVELMK